MDTLTVDYRAFNPAALDQLLEGISKPTPRNATDTPMGHKQAIMSDLKSGKARIVYHLASGFCDILSPDTSGQ